MRHLGPALPLIHQRLKLGSPDFDQRKLRRHEETVQGDQ